MRNGKHIVLEGMDCSGKSTLAAALHTRLLDLGRSPKLFRFPSDGPVGKLIRQALYGELTIEREAMLYLFTADGVDNRRYIDNQTQDGHDVISDRHPNMCAWVYQRQEHPLRSIEAVHNTAPLAEYDGLFVLDLPASVALRRQRNRTKQTDVVYEPDFEDPEALAKTEATRQYYLELAGRHGATVFDGLRPTHELVDDIVERMDP